MSAVKDLIKSSYAVFLTVSNAVLGIDKTKVLDAKIRFKRTINLDNPKSLADKVSYISLHTLPKIAADCTDKWAVRDYIKQKGLEEILIPVFGQAVSNAEDINFDLFEDKFVLKGTHGCAMNYVCLDKNSADEDAIRSMAQKWLNTTYGTFSVEPHYKNIPHRVYCEKCLGSAEEMVDYKIHCINGEPSFVLVCGDRGRNSHGSTVDMNIFDVNWKHMDVVVPYKGHVPGDGNIEKPENWEKMLEIARILSADFDFVRVDLYNIRGKIYFGELTFTPANCVFPSYSEDFLLSEGSKLKISER